MKKAVISTLLMLVAFAAWAQIPRAEYPRPQFERQDWLNLNGEWSYTFDFVGSGMEKKLNESNGFDGKIGIVRIGKEDEKAIGSGDVLVNVEGLTVGRIEREEIADILVVAETIDQCAKQQCQRHQ